MKQYQTGNRAKRNKTGRITDQTGNPTGKGTQGRPPRRGINWTQSLVVLVAIVLGNLLYQNNPLDSLWNEDPQEQTVEASVESEVLQEQTVEAAAEATSINLDEIPPFSDVPYVELNGNQPGFTQEDLTTEAFEEYSELDDLGRCGVAYANICKEIMPTEERGEIGQVKPSGWHTVKYDCVDGKYLYNRCHLIGYQLAGENANEKNLITGTRYLNVQGMLPFENQVASYVQETENHVLYRVTPIFRGDNLVASGVELEGYSVEDAGEGICFHVYVYNNQPGVEIDYATGDSSLIPES